MLSETFLTKVTLQHFLYQTGGNTYDQQNQNLHQQTSNNNNNNYFQYTAPNTKNVPVYGVRPRIGVSDYDPGNNGESGSSIDVMYLKNIHKK
jgi:hypothetical protein